MNLVEVLDDGERLRQPRAVVLEHGDDRERVESVKRRSELLSPAPGQVNRAIVVGQAFQPERDAHAIRGRASKVIVELDHERLSPSAPMRIVIEPMPSMLPRSSSPALTAPTPAGVPV